MNKHIESLTDSEVESLLIANLTDVDHKDLKVALLYELLKRVRAELLGFVDRRP